MEFDLNNNLIDINKDDAVKIINCCHDRLKSLGDRLSEDGEIFHKIKDVETGHIYEFIFPKNMKIVINTKDNLYSTLFPTEI